MHPDITDPPLAHGEPLFSAVLKKNSADFLVYEDLVIDFSEQGEHLYVQIEKSSMNTDEVLSLLQQCYTVDSADVGYCGLKDRYSVSTQWFSVRTAEQAEVLNAAVSEYNAEQTARWGKTDPFLKQLRLVQHARHTRKLRRGAHSANRFVITLHAVNPLSVTHESLEAAVKKRIAQIAQSGFPAYIGPQRFGEGARNIQRAQQWFNNPRKRTSRQQRSLLLSAARSALFNLVCAARVRDGSWNKVVEGQPLMLDGSSSFFVPDIGHSGDSSANKESCDTHSSTASETLPIADNLSAEPVPEKSSAQESLQRRAEQFDVHPSAPWWGRGRPLATAHCGEYEQQILEPYQKMCAGIEKAGLDQERRAIRSIADNLESNWLDESTLQVKFSLKPGVFATSLIRELGVVTEPTRKVSQDEVKT